MVSELLICSGAVLVIATLFAAVTIKKTVAKRGMYAGVSASKLLKNK